MNSLLTLALVVVFVTAARGGVDDCAAHVFDAGHCCKVGDLFPKFKKTQDNGCKLKHLTGKFSVSQIIAAYSCVIECSLDKAGLLTADKTLDKTAIAEFLTPADAAMVPLFSPIVEKCFDIYGTDIDSSAGCKSGAIELLKCFKRETFLNCPSSRWTASSGCDDVKSKVIKCTNVPVRLIH